MKKLVTALLGLTALTAVPMSANAYPVVDQGDYPFATYVGEPHPGIYYGQSFTVGIAGQLSEIALPLGRISDNNSTLTVYIIRTAGSSLDGAPLAQVAIPFADLPIFPTQWPSGYMNRLFTVNLAPYHVTVSVGETLAIVIGADTPESADWFGGCDAEALIIPCGASTSSPGYGRGYAFSATSLTGAYTINHNVTMGFQTFVDPTPFTGNPGSSNCIEQSAADLTIQYGGLSQAAASLGYSSAQTLESAIVTFCGG